MPIENLKVLKRNKIIESCNFLVFPSSNTFIDHLYFYLLIRLLLTLITDAFIALPLIQLHIKTELKYTQFC